LLNSSITVDFDRINLKIGRINLENDRIIPYFSRINLKTAGLPSKMTG
jgi:hypothetical protein